MTRSKWFWKITLDPLRMMEFRVSKASTVSNMTAFTRHQLSIDIFFSFPWNMTLKYKMQLSEGSWYKILHSKSRTLCFSKDFFFWRFVSRSDVPKFRKQFSRLLCKDYQGKLTLLEPLHNPCPETAVLQRQREKTLGYSRTGMQTSPSESVILIPLPRCLTSSSAGGRIATAKIVRNIRTHFQWRFQWPERMRKVHTNTNKHWRPSWLFNEYTGDNETSTIHPGIPKQGHTF